MTSPRDGRSQGDADYRTPSPLRDVEARRAEAQRALDALAERGVAEAAREASEASARLERVKGRTVALRPWRFARSVHPFGAILGGPFWFGVTTCGPLPFGAAALVSAAGIDPFGALPWGPMAWVGVMLALPLAVLSLGYVGTRGAAAHALAWLRSLPFPLAGYDELISGDVLETFHLQVTFADEGAPNVERMTHILRGAGVPFDSVTNEGAVVRLASSRSLGEMMLFMGTNYPAHRWARRALRALTTVHAGHPIARVVAGGERVTASD